MASRAMSVIFLLACLVTFITPALAQYYEVATGKIACIPPGGNLLCTARITGAPVNWGVNPPRDGYYEVEIFDPACNNLMYGGSATGYYGDTIVVRSELRYDLILTLPWGWADIHSERGLYAGGTMYDTSNWLLWGPDNSKVWTMSTALYGFYC